jgi:hypothetical protein
MNQRHASHLGSSAARCSRSMRPDLLERMCRERTTGRSRAGHRTPPRRAGARPTRTHLILGAGKWFGVHRGLTPRRVDLLRQHAHTHVLQSGVGRIVDELADLSRAQARVWVCQGLLPIWQPAAVHFWPSGQLPGSQMSHSCPQALPPPSGAKPCSVRPSSSEFSLVVASVPVPVLPLVLIDVDEPRVFLRRRFGRGAGTDETEDK